ncbi:hypothetical protein BKA64DRAFT_714528 [Cadophora sp. MPI-SDFR-AT-0126]|nr:hypothetical protein BKA64DRAFT_714528 [Leotiomycetes sp. MPI-SDFR-AT-0126]
MAEVFAVAASVIAVIQISDRVIELCKFYIEALAETPSSLRALLIEISTLKTIFEALQFLERCDHSTPALWMQISAPEGPIEECRRALTELEKLFPPQFAQRGAQNTHLSKRQKLNVAFSTIVWPLKQSQVKEILQRIGNYKAIIQLAVTTESSQDIKDLKASSKEIKRSILSAQRNDLCNWLVLTDPSPLHNRARRLYEPGTGSWMLRTAEWNDWLAGRNGHVWIHGIPGAGKTILASWLIEEAQKHCTQIRSQSSICVYYYCYFGHNQDETMAFLRWVISQLLRHTETVPAIVDNLFKRGGEPSIAELLDSLEMVLRVWSVVYLVIDAIDESNPRQDLLQTIRDLATSPRFMKLQLLITSREYRDIELGMEGITKCVPMSNRLVEQDIRIYVQSAIQSNKRFKRWPKDLHLEVEQAISTQAKGMFRWAVCQLDALQHLRSERSTVRKALAMLPKDLDETYERVFLRIPEEQWSFVRHVFYWLCFYQELDIHWDGFPCMLLLDAARNSTLRSGQSTDDYYYDSERLKELCGCLITLQQVDFEETLVTFAHYTVKEYLDSRRILQGPTSSFSTEMATISPICLDVVFSQAQSVTDGDLVRLKEGNKIFDGDDWSYLAQVFPIHCAFCALNSLRVESLSLEICANETLFSRMKSLLEPSRQYFRRLGECRVAGKSDFELPLGRYAAEHDCTMVWTVVWTESATETEAALLLSLLLIAGDQICPLAMKILGEMDLNILLGRKVVLEMSVTVVEIDEDGGETIIDVNHTFSGSVIEVMAQFANHSFESFCLLLKRYPGYYDPSTTLLHFIGYHGLNALGHYSCNDDHNFDCPVRTLLEAEAEPNLMGYRVTPLQIAVAAWDLEGVQLLLAHGADPDGTGDPKGIVWPRTSPMFKFNGLHGKSALQICRTRECRHLAYNVQTERMSDLEQIERLLLQGRRNLSSAR